MALVEAVSKFEDGREPIDLHLESETMSVNRRSVAKIVNLLKIHPNIAIGTLTLESKDDTKEALLYGRIRFLYPNKYYLNE